MRKIIILSGSSCTGKTSLAHLIAENPNFFLVRSKSIINNASYALGQGIPATPLELQKWAESLELEEGSEWIVDEIKKSDEDLSKDMNIVVDYVSSPVQIKALRHEAKWRIVHVHLYCSNAATKKRETEKYNEAAVAGIMDDAVVTSDIDYLKEDADIRVWTDRLDVFDLYARVATRIGLVPPPNERFVDVIVGGQYGSEGKGQIVGYLSKEYDVLIRVGGPNAGHTVSSDTGIYTYHHLPSGSRDCSAEIYLGPGMTINPVRLLEEIEECRVDKKRLFIDPQAMIIEQEDVTAEQDLVQSIASTGQGGGAAAARRIMGRNSGGVRLARDVKELKDYISPIIDKLESAYRCRKSILLEGTQGSGLSIFHGQYPHVTSRDTNVAGCLAEAGISPTRVRRVIMVIRSHPIRVGHPKSKDGNSGCLKHETTWDEIANRSGLDASDLKLAEKTSTTKKDRRVGYFEWDQFRKACALNAPTDLVLTFVDYMNFNNRNARRFDQLDDETLYFIEELERVGNAPVSIINTRFPKDSDIELKDIRSVIDRRNWNGLWHPESRYNPYINLNT